MRYPSGSAWLYDSSLSLHHRRLGSEFEPEVHHLALAFRRKSRNDARADLQLCRRRLRIGQVDAFEIAAQRSVRTIQQNVAKGIGRIRQVIELLIDHGERLDASAWPHLHPI